MGPHAEAVGEVVHAVERDAGPHRGVHVLEAGLVGGIVGGERDQRREVSAGRAAGDDDEVRIDAVRRPLLADPAQRLLEIDEGSPGRSPADSGGSWR